MPTTLYSCRWCLPAARALPQLYLPTTDWNRCLRWYIRWPRCPVWPRSSLSGTTRRNHRRRVRTVILHTGSHDIEWSLKSWAVIEWQRETTLYFITAQSTALYLPFSAMAACNYTHTWKLVLSCNSCTYL